MQDKCQGCKLKPPQQLCAGNCILWGISEIQVSQNHPGLALREVLWPPLLYLSKVFPSSPCQHQQYCNVW